jgi:hypothetical protein
MHGAHRVDIRQRAFQSAEPALVLLAIRMEHSGDIAQEHAKKEPNAEQGEVQDH